MLGLTWADWLHARSLAHRRRDWSSEIGRADLALGWAGPSRYLGPQAQCAARISRPVPADRHAHAGNTHQRDSSRTWRIVPINSRFCAGLHTGSNDHRGGRHYWPYGQRCRQHQPGRQHGRRSAAAGLGAVVARTRGGSGSLPPFLVVGGKLHQGKKAIAGEGGGVLGGLYDPFRLEYAAGEGFRIPASN